VEVKCFDTEEMLKATNMIVAWTKTPSDCYAAEIAKIWECSSSLKAKKNHRIYQWQYFIDRILNYQW